MGESSILVRVRGGQSPCIPFREAFQIPRLTPRTVSSSPENRGGCRAQTRLAPHLLFTNRRVKREHKRIRAQPFLLRVFWRLN